MATVDIDGMIAERKALIRKAQEELADLERVRAMSGGKNGQQAPASERMPRPGGIPALAYTALKANGKPMRIEDLADAVLKAGCTSERHVVISVIYKAAKNGRWFRSAGPGTFGLFLEKHD